MTNTNNISFIVVPDVHGRSFWRDALPYISNGVPTVFLGDYIDPYPHEGIAPSDAYDMLKEIIDIAKQHDNVTLLIGNHDCGYMFTRYINDCRTDNKNFIAIRNTYRENGDLFKVAKSFNVDGKPFLMTHAGVDVRWLSTIGYVDGDIDTFINSKIQHNSDYSSVTAALGIIPWCRGGMTTYGSCVWQDMSCWNTYSITKPPMPVGINQIVGHTMQIKKQQTESGGFTWVGSEPLRIGDVLCVDCQKCFYVDKEGDVRELNTDKLID